MPILQTATSTVAATLSLVQSFSLDVIVIAGMLAALFGFALRYGKESIVALILGLYVALLAFIHFPYKERFLLFTSTDTQVLISNALIFVAFAIIGYLAIARMVRHRYHTHSAGRWGEALLLSAATTALLIAFSYHVLPVTSVYSFGTPIANLFSSPAFFFWWLMVPLAVLFMVGRR